MSVSKSTRRTVLRRDGGQCRFVLFLRCDARDRLTLHHIVAVRDGGSDGHANLVTVCADHHRLIESNADERNRQHAAWGAGKKSVGRRVISGPMKRFRHKRGCTPANCVYSCEVGWR